MNTMNAHNLPILREYIPFNVDRLEGRAIQSGKAIYVVNNGNFTNNNNNYYYYYNFINYYYYYRNETSCS